MHFLLQREAYGGIKRTGWSLPKPEMRIIVELNKSWMSIIVMCFAQCIHPSSSLTPCSLCMMWTRRWPLLFSWICVYIYIHMDIIYDMILWFSLVFYDSECVQIVQKYEVGPPQFSRPGLAGITSI